MTFFSPFQVVIFLAISHFHGTCPTGTQTSAIDQSWITIMGTNATFEDNTPEYLSFLDCDGVYTWFCVHRDCYLFLLWIRFEFNIFCCLYGLWAVVGILYPSFCCWSTVRYGTCMTMMQWGWIFAPVLPSAYNSSCTTILVCRRDDDGAAFLLINWNTLRK